MDLNKREEIIKEVINNNLKSCNEIKDFELLDDELKEKIKEELMILNNLDVIQDYAEYCLKNNDFGGEPITENRISSFYDLSIATSNIIKKCILEIEDNNQSYGFASVKERIRNEYINKLVYDNNNRLYISECDKVEYINRLKKPYTKNGVTKTFYEQFKNGDGNELDGKFFSIRSSSRLCFDLFSHLAKDDKIFDIEFEYHLPGLYTTNSIHKPNIDVYIKEDSKISFIESKYTEYEKNSISDVPDAYYKEFGDAYSTKGEEIKSYLIDRYGGNKELEKWLLILINGIIDYVKEEDIDNKYDWFNLKQAVTHTYGIAQWIYLNRNTISGSVYFYYVYYDFEDGISNLAMKFRSIVNIIMRQYLKDINADCNFYFKFISSKEYSKKITDAETRKMLKEKYNI